MTSTLDQPTKRKDDTMIQNLNFNGIPLLINWVQGEGFGPEDAPKSAGIYAQIHWLDRAARIGQSANIRNRVREATSWARGMHLGIRRASDLRRTSPICERVKATGSDGFAYFLISDDKRLADKETRLACEAYLFGWFQAISASDGWTDWNLERVQKKFRTAYDEALCEFQLHPT